MGDYPWYKILKNLSDLEQGDIINNCIVPLVNENVYNNIINSQEEEIEDAINTILLEKAIILSQSCDILHSKIDSVIVCPVWALKELIKTNSYFNSSKARESLRQGKEPAYHLINEFKGEINLEFSVVDFHRIYSLPKSYIKEIAKNQIRLRLLPPYREHLSQAFARYFMRVGLPININKELIKNLKLTL
jgi:hypothetical protein